MTSEDVHMEDLVDSSIDWSSLDSYNSDLDELLNDDDTEMMLLLFGMKQMEGRAKLLDQRKGFLAAHRSIEDAETHHQLTQDLIDHHWQLHGQ
jgi:hypothetical protein